MSKELSQDILGECAEAFKLARKGVYSGAALLYRIEQENLWEGRFSSFSDYVESELQISKGFASKLLQSWKFYVITNGVSPRNLEGVGEEKLYLALKIPGTAEEKLVRAREWTRRELQDEAASKDGVDCEHPDTILICATCSKRI